MRTDESMKAIAFGTHKITDNLHHQDRKRMRIVVSPELTVDVFAPASANKEQIEAAVMKKAAWIAGKLDALKRYHPLPAPLLLIRTMRRRWGSCSPNGRITLNLNIV